MKRSFLLAGAVFLTGAMLSQAAATADKSASTQMDPKMAEMMKKAEISGTPGAAHKALEPLVGNWNAEVKCWMDPAAEPMVTKGTAKATWILDGRFVQEEFSGEFMGKPFKGISLTGYDNTKQKYNNVWIDDMHTALFTSEGAAESGNKVFTLEGKMDCPMTGEKDVTMKQVIRVVSRDKHVLEMYDSRKPDVKSMEITYTRK
jgi:hypothetical protein